MKRSKVIMLLIGLVVGFYSCSDPRTELSPLTIEAESPFVVSQIIEGENGEIICIGYDNAISGWATEDGTVVRIYSKGLNLDQEIAEEFATKVDGFQNVTPYAGNQFIVIGVDTSGVIPRFHVTIRDRQMTVLKENHLLGKYNFKTNEVMSVLIRSNGQISLIATNEKLLPNGGTEASFINHYLLDKEPTIINNTELSYTEAVNSVLLEDESILVLGANDFFRYDSATGFFTFGKEFLSRRVLQDNNVVEVEVVPLYYSHVQVAGFNRIGNRIVHHSISNDEHVLRYAYFNSDNGEYIDMYTLPSIYTNHVYRNFESNFHFKFGSANPVSYGPDGVAGHFLYSNIDENITFFELSETGTVSPTFSLNLPPLDEILSYRQCFTKDGHLVAGVSYKYNGKLYFTLQTLDLDGNIIKENRAQEQ